METWEKAFASLIVMAALLWGIRRSILDTFPGMALYSLVLILWHMMQPDFYKSPQARIYWRQKQSLCHDKIQIFILFLVCSLGCFFSCSQTSRGTLFFFFSKSHGSDLLSRGICFKRETDFSYLNLRDGQVRLLWSIKGRVKQ